jgi:hypothetical protein
MLPFLLWVFPYIFGHFFFAAGPLQFRPSAHGPETTLSPALRLGKTTDLDINR